MHYKSRIKELKFLQSTLAMFKKPVKIGAQNQLSGKDRKIMRNKLVELFNEACVDKLMNVNEKIISCKTSGSKMMIYLGEDYPLFVDGTGKNDYFPSLYTAIAYEPLLKILDINQGVESYIYNGANLMWPGVRDYAGLGNFEKDQVVGIRTAKGQVVAIGAMGCSLKELQSNRDNSGVAVYILHYYNDKLWDQGPKTKPQVIVAAEQPKKVEEKVQEKVEEKVQKKKQEAKVERKQQTKPQKKQKPQKKGKKQQSQDEEQQVVKNNKKQKQQKKGKKQQSSQEQVEKKQQPKTNKKQKQQKKGKKQSSQDEPQVVNKQPEKSKQQDKGKTKDNKGKDKKQPEQPQQPKRKELSEKQEEDDDEVDLSSFVHTKKTVKQAPKIEKKGPQKNFSDDEQDDKKNKKKPAKKQNKKKGGKKQESSDQEEGGEAKQAEEKHEQQKSSVSTKLMDQQFKQAFLNALKLSKVEGELPIDSGRFFMDFMLLARPAGVKLEIKDTSYKKLGKFYEQMSKLKFIQFKHNKDKKGQQGSSIVKIMWDNEQLKNYEPTILRMGEKDVEQKDQVVDSKKKLKLTQSLVVENVYKLHQNFKAAAFPKKVNYAPTEQEEAEMKKQEEKLQAMPQFYSEQQARAMIEKYINESVTFKKQKQEKEDDKGKRQKADKMITIDYKKNNYLADLLKKQILEFEENKREKSDSQQEQGKKPRRKQPIMRMERGALVNRILKTFSTSYHMANKQTGLEVFNQGTFKGIQLIAEKSNNKNITRIMGLETFIVPKEEAEEQIHGFANMLKEKFACSVNVLNLPGKHAGKEIVAHGNFISELEDMFMQEYKIREEYIATQNKLDKKKKAGYQK